MDLNKLIDYDQWANKKVLEVVCTTEVENSNQFSEIRKLLSHLFAAQQIWIARITGESAGLEIWPDLSLQEIQELMEENPGKLRAQIHKKDQVVSYSNSSGTPFSNTVEEVLTHLAIHGQHHRAQIARLLRGAGAEPPTTDLIFYLRTQ